MGATESKNILLPTTISFWRARVRTTLKRLGLFKNSEKVVKFNPILQERVRSYVAVGSVIMAVLGLSYAADIPISEGVKLALYSAALTASLPPVNFYNAEKLQNFILSKQNNG